MVRRGSAGGRSGCRRPAGVASARHSSTVHPPIGRNAPGARASVPRRPPLSALARRLPILVPPLVIAAIVGFLLVRSGSGGDREAREAAIQVRWGTAVEFGSLAGEIEAYVAEHGADAEGRWFAAEAWARIGKYTRAFDAVFGPKAPAPSGADARRFATLLLPLLGHPPGDFGASTWFYPRFLQVRVEAGDPKALAELSEIVAALSWTDVSAFYIPFHRRPSPAAAALSAGLLSRSGVRELAVVGASLGTGPGDVAHVPLFLEVLRGSWRLQHRAMWEQSVYALGVSGAPEGVAALRAERERLVEKGLAADYLRLSLDIGLALADDAVARNRVLEGIAAGKTAEWAGPMYAIGLQTKWARGSRPAAAALDVLFDVRSDATMLQVGIGCLLADPLPEGSGPFLDRVAKAFARSEEAVERVAAHIHDFRRGRTDALATLVRDLGAHLVSTDLVAAKMKDEGSVTPIIEILRAFACWAR